MTEDKSKKSDEPVYGVVNQQKANETIDAIIQKVKKTNPALASEISADVVEVKSAVRGFATREIALKKQWDLDKNEFVDKLNEADAQRKLALNQNEWLMKRVDDTEQGAWQSELSAHGVAFKENPLNQKKQSYEEIFGIGK